ncbi:hypothetical protein PQQ53_09430 [Paraburkholderia strydomiana]|jgi:hypothetical protein|uniref:hypothetical protein n=1 Tax=Paraburkholderia strydomiana TaxID=1245417 RepID=UPI0038BD0EB3
MKAGTINRVAPVSATIRTAGNEPPAMPMATKVHEPEDRLMHPPPAQRHAHPDRDEPTDDEERNPRVQHEHCIGRPDRGVVRSALDTDQQQYRTAQHIS